MAISAQTMTPEQMKSVVIEYFKRFDRGGDVLALFADDADVYFPKRASSTWTRTTPGPTPSATTGCVSRRRSRREPARRRQS